MAIDFPNSPSNGDIYTVSGKRWQWDGEKWQAYGASLAPGVLYVDQGNARVGINDTTPSYSLDVTGTARVTGVITASGGVVGNVTGNASGTALTVTQPAQTAITSLGTLTGLQITSATQYAGLRVSDANTTIGEIVGFAADNDAGGLKLYNAGTANVQLLSSGVSYLNGGNVGLNLTSGINARLTVQGGLAIGSGSSVSSTDGGRRSIQIDTDTSYGGTSNAHSGFRMHTQLNAGGYLWQRGDGAEGHEGRYRHRQS